jgi:hypothetical protein
LSHSTQNRPTQKSFMASKWRKVDIYEKKLNFMVMSPKEVLANAENMNIPNKEKYLTTLKTWEEAFAKIDTLRKKNAGNADYLKFLDQNEQTNSELYNSVRTRLQTLYDREVSMRSKIKKKATSTSTDTTLKHISDENLIPYPDFNAMTPQQVINKLNEVDPTNKHYKDVQSVVTSLKPFVEYFKKVEGLKIKHADDKKLLKQVVTNEEKNRDIFISNLAAAKQTYAMANDLYIPIEEEATRNDKKDTSHMFTDEEFTPSMTNINWEKKRAIAWRRPCQLVDDPQFTVDGISIDDIIQGTLGDCYMISSLACLTTRSHLLVERCFVSQDVAYGKYTFRFNKNGEEALVTVDDRLPVSVNGKLVSAHSKTKNEFWVALLEKAYAKFCGGYDKIGEGGSPSDALSHICGGVKFGHNVLEWKDVNTTWSELIQLRDRGALLSCYAMGEVVESMDKYGIVHMHAYSVLSIVEAHDGDKMVRLLKLRNPWGDKEWMGAYSDDHGSWTQSLIEQLNVVFEKDGVFYIEIQDFFSEFAAVEGVLHY